MRPVLLLGKNGQLGFELHRQLTSHYPLTVLGSAELDLADEQAIRNTVRNIQPGLIINTAAYTAVDRAETEPSLAFAINATAPAILAEEAGRLDGALVHYSTDYVFDGDSSTPYRETDPVNPQNIYGLSKQAGEQAVMDSGVPALVFRTSWVYGPRGHNFLLTMLRLLTEREELRVVDDQLGAPTSVLALAQATQSILRQAQEQKWPEWMGQYRGIYHMTCSGQTSWFGFASAIAQHLQSQGRKVAHLVPIPSEEYPTPARRPYWSVLDNTKLLETFGVSLAGWREALGEVFALQ